MSKINSTHHLNEKERRILLLDSLLNRSDDVEKIIDSLEKFNFDSEPLIILTRDHLINILSDYISGKIAASELERWANIIEVRDDISYEPEFLEKIKEVVFELSNPILFGEINLDSAINLMNIIKK